MPTIVDTEVSKPARITGRVMSGVVILFLQIGRASCRERV